MKRILSIFTAILLTAGVAQAAQQAQTDTRVQYNYNKSADSATHADRGAETLSNFRRSLHPTADRTHATRRERQFEENRQAAISETERRSDLDEQRRLSRLEASADARIDADARFAAMTSEEKERADQIARNIQEDRSLEPVQDLIVIVEADSVTLIGTVPSEEQKMAIADKARALPSVNRVNNNLEVMKDNR